MELTAGTLARVQWGAVTIALFAGLLNTGAFLAYVMAFHWANRPPTIELAYFIRLIWQPWLVLGFGMSLAAICLRMWLFQDVGGQRAWFVSSVGIILNTILVATVLRDSMSPLQWTGGGLVMVGSVIAAIK